jgi:hypothetical protein
VELLPGGGYARALCADVQDSNDATVTAYRQEMLQEREESGILGSSTIFDSFLFDPRSPQREENGRRVAGNIALLRGFD